MESATRRGTRECRSKLANDEEARYHLIKKCKICALYKAKNKACLSKGHPQVIRTVTKAEVGDHYVCVQSGETMNKTTAHGHFYYRVKPGSRLFVWDGGKKVEISSEHASTLETVHLAPGTILQRSSRVAHVVMLWMDASDDALVEHAIPDMSKPRLMPKDEVGYPATCLQVDIDQTLLVQGKTNSAREKPEGAASRAPKRRKTRRSTAGIRIRAVVGDEGDGNSGGRISSDKMDTPAGQGSAAERQREAQVMDQEPSMAFIPTKEEVEEDLAEKLKACDERELELNSVIKEAKAKLEANNEARKAAIAGSNAQFLAVIARREAYAAHCEKLAAEARAQNISDRESLAKVMDISVGATEPPQPTVEQTAPHEPPARESHEASASSRNNQANAVSPKVPPERGGSSNPGGAAGGSTPVPGASSTAMPQQNMWKWEVNDGVPTNPGRLARASASPTAAATTVQVGALQFPHGQSMLDQSLPGMSGGTNMTSHAAATLNSKAGAPTEARVTAVWGQAGMQQDKGRAPAGYPDRAPAPAQGAANGVLPLAVAATSAAPRPQDWQDMQDKIPGMPRGAGSDMRSIGSPAGNWSMAAQTARPALQFWQTMAQNVPARQPIRAMPPASAPLVAEEARRVNQPNKVHSQTSALASGVSPSASPLIKDSMQTNGAGVTVGPPAPAACNAATSMPQGATNQSNS